MSSALHPLIVFPQATSARRAFPCWDEPLLKANFSVTMISRADTVNLSNMPVVSEKVYSTGADSADDSLASSLAALSIGEVSNQWKITRFEKSPLVRMIILLIILSDPWVQMSTYLVAYANGVFGYLESSYTSPLSGKTRPLRVYGASISTRPREFHTESNTSQPPPISFL